MSDAEQPPIAARRAYWPFWTACALTLGFVVLGLVQGVPFARFFDENGPVENASVAIFLCGAVGFVLLRPRVALGRGWQVTMLLLLLAARELDFDKRFLDKGILQSRLYTGEYPLSQKLIGAVALCVILFTLYRLVRYGARPLLAGLRARALWAWAVVLACVTVVIAKSLDGAGRKLAPYGIELSAETGRVLLVLEEVGELAFGLLLVLAVSDWVRRSLLRDAAL